MNASTDGSAEAFCVESALGDAYYQTAPLSAKALPHIFARASTPVSRPKHQLTTCRRLFLVEP